MDLYQELELRKRQLMNCIKELRVNGAALADAERDYKVRLRAECLQLRDEGMPVTLIQLTAYGVPEVAELRHARDFAQVIYDANKDSIQALKLELRIIDNQIAHELGGPGLGVGNM